MAHNDGPADDVGVAADVLGDRMDNHIDAMIERPLYGGRGECVVHQRQDTEPPADGRDAAEIGQSKQRVAGRLDPDERRSRRHSGFHRLGICGVHMGHRQLRRMAAHAVEQAPAAAIDLL